MSLKNIMKDGFFFILAADHRESLKRLLNTQDEKEIIRVKKNLANVLSPHASGFLLDPVYGAKAIDEVKSGLILSREKSGYVGRDDNRKTVLLDDWDAEKLKGLGADAIKLLIYYNPEKSARGYQEKLVRKVSQECKRENIPLICEFSLYGVEENRDLYIVKSAERISKLGIDVLKTEAPSTLRNCRKLTKRIKVPWIVLSGGKEYDEFKKSVEIACKGGASGFAGGRAIWQDTIKDEKLLKTVSVERLKELSEIVKDNGNPLVIKNL